MRIENLCKAYGEQVVLDHLTLSIDHGVTCLMAPSGSGKTTLLRILLGLETADSGTLSDLPNRWGVLFQENRLLERLTAMENLYFAIGPALDEASARALLTRLGLGEEGEKPVRDYSGGMKRRLALARALLAPSDALALDEPFTGLDEENKAVCMELIRETAKAKPVLLVTHDSGDAEGLNADIINL